MMMMRRRRMRIEYSFLLGLVHVFSFGFMYY
jgi:cell division protein FtsB